MTWDRTRDASSGSWLLYHLTHQLLRNIHFLDSRNLTVESESIWQKLVLLDQNIEVIKVDYSPVNQFQEVYKWRKTNGEIDQTETKILVDTDERLKNQRIKRYLRPSLATCPLMS